MRKFTTKAAQKAPQSGYEIALRAFSQAVTKKPATGISRITLSNKDIIDAIRVVKRARTLHVVPDNSATHQWGVKSEGSGRFKKVFGSKTAAIEGAKMLARTSGMGLVIHGKNGQIQESLRDKIEYKGISKPE